ncbi:putative F-box protein [Senna tora]|uniref:Putative F-box protein n=1 Tax=Senna tora TaxID=362788 RepID=A0A834W7F4_9FABA|nr:putative F-box protein [Senna tora]
MASLQTSNMLSSSLKTVDAAIHVPKLPRIPLSLPKIPTSTKTNLIQEFNGAIHTVIPSQKDVTPSEIYDDLCHPGKLSKVTTQLYAILEAVADRIEMHKNIGEQRQNWNNLLLNSINMITLTAATMVGVATISDASAPILALKISSTLLFSAATGMSLIMSKLQPSQLAEEQRNATRLLKQLQTQIQTTLAFGNPTEEDVKSAMEKVLALDKAYPLPLLGGAMLPKFPTQFEPAVWWPKSLWWPKSRKLKTNKISNNDNNNNGWSEELEMEMREIIEVMKAKDMEDYDRLGNLVLKVNKAMAISGPLLSGLAAVGSAFVGHGSPWAAVLAVTSASLATSINAFEHGGQVGMVFEMYRNCGGFFKLLQETIESTLEERDYEKRENGDVFEMKVAMKLGRSVSQLRQLASKSASYELEGIAIDEFASKLF